MKTQRQVQKEETRKRIIEAAFAEYAGKGFAATRTADIARAADVAHGTVFAHFPTQETLISKVIEEFGIRVSFRLHELAQRDMGLRSVLEAHMRGLSEYEAFYSRLIQERHLLPDSAKNTFVLIQSSISFHISQAAAREMATGKILKVPIHMLFNTWMGLVHYYIENSDLFAPEGSVLKRCGEELIEHYMRMIQAKEKAFPDL